ncbi:hydantoinase/oxoprolinase family protein [Kaistia dalseonensis]|uniref:N-methylhydantoinase A n=1 Tax=Kaistia dalseonensis TaxID=410840 RepID=A0ABU0H703_9HYPH|nr:hydantoinase/oxoprolinase family protein [Kaistia dalseonensis]MCX5495504.1 hydantoinase/oxoprolinase family protein [Kaistia dalseonensis]MDQ0438096.1 N-methylhydantoinase A [Kaistia dalseonensis]
MSRWIVGIDVGGTFTDLVAVGPDGKIHATKTPSTRDQSDGVLTALARLAADLGMDLDQLLAELPLIVHGTTVATNSLLEYDGAKVGLITTSGFRDEIEFRRSYKESVFDPRLKAPYAIVPRRYRIGVSERVDHKGTVLTPLDENEVRAALAGFRAEGIEAVAVCFLFSFVNPAHERRVAEIVREVMPEAFLSLSSEVLPEIREFERVSTTVVNAFVGPRMNAYLTHLESRLRERGFGGELFVIQSNGGVQSAGEAGSFAVNGLLSGPAGGVTAGSFLGEIAGYPNLITVDMGGTSYDIALIESLRPAVTTESWIGRYRIALPMLDIHTIGAGGGSIAWIDAGGALQVGPASAGSNPGPACYGRGGTRPTVTDANVVLGLLNPDFFLGGEMQLDRKAAEDAILHEIAEPLGLSVVEAALAISEIVNNNMANATRLVTTKRGHDPQQFALVAAGGAGALHVGKQAEELGIQTVIVPSLAPVFCALGDTVADLRVSEARTHIGLAETVDFEALNDAFQEIEARARQRLSTQSLVRNFDVRRSLDLHYAGEVHEVTVPVRARTRRITRLNLDATIADFHALHERLFAHKDLAQPVEILTLRVDLIGVREKPRLPAADFGDEDPSVALKNVRPVHFDVEALEASVYDGALLKPGNFIEGPAIIEQWGTTIVVHPGHECLIDAYGNIIIEIGQAARNRKATLEPERFPG